MKTEKIRILFVEDVENDMRLALKELQKGNVDCAWVRVETRDDFLLMLNDFYPDIVICNYAIPLFSGLESFTFLRESAVGIPVVLCGDSIDEETVVACIKTGVSDFVLKSNLKRLPGAIIGALAHTAIGKSGEKLSLYPGEPDANHRTLLESSNDIAFLKDEKFRYILVNNAIQSFLGKDESEILGKTDFELMPAETAESFRNSDTKAIEKKTLVVTLEQIGNRTFESRKFPVVLQNGMTGVGGFVQDINNRHEAEKLLRLQRIDFYSAENAVVIFNMVGTILSINTAFTRLTGYTAEEAIGKNAIDLLKSEVHNDEFYYDIWDTILKGNVWHGKMTNKKKDRTNYNEEIVITPVTDSYGNVFQFVGVKQEIPEHLTTEWENANIDRSYRQLVDISNLGIFMVSLRGEFLQINETLRKMLDYKSVENLMRTHVQHIFKHTDQWKNIAESIVTGNKIRNYEVDLVTVDGNSREVILNAILEENKIMCLVVDMTKQRRIETRLLKAKTKAEESDKLKTFFLSSMNHDVRIPINAIQGFVELLASSGLKENEKTAYLNMISRSTQQLLKTINDFAEISKVATRKITANPISFELNLLLKEVYTELEPGASEKKLKLDYHPGLPDGTSRIRFDDQKLRYILVNLVDNAIKFSDTGVVDFGYTVKDSIIELYVQDTGRGISPEYQKIIFERFRKVDDPFTRKTDGSGLGLAIVKAYVEFLGGEISVKSEPGNGSRFIVTIPYLPDEATVKPIPERFYGEVNLQKRRILVAEDDETNYMFMERLLSRTNCTILRAVNGQEAVDRCASDTNIDLVLMDINMPFMNGLDATRIIKTRLPGLPIIAVTAYSLSGDKETCIAAGCDDYIPKPIHRDELYLKLHKCLAN